MLLEVLGEILIELRAIRAAVEASPSAPTVDDRARAVLAALADTLGDDLDVPFTPSEVLRHADTDHALAEALRLAGIRDARKLGCVFRSARDRDLDGLTLRRDGEEWRIDRT